MSGVTIYEGEDKTKMYLLDKNELVEGTLTSRVAFCENVEERVDKNNKPFFVISMRDVNGVKVVGRHFNTADYINSGVIIRKLEGSIIKIEFSAEMYNRDLSLIINDVRIVPENLGVTKDLFLGVVEDVDGIVECIYRKLGQGASDNFKIYDDIIKGNKLVQSVQTSYMEEVKQGKIGGGVWFIGRMLDLINQTLTEGEASVCKLQYTLAEIVRLRVRMVGNTEESFLGNKAPIIRELDNLLEKVSLRNNKAEVYESFREECNHILDVMLDGVEPKTMNAHIVKSLRSSLIKIEEVKSLNNSLTVKGIKRVGDLEIIRMR